MTRRRLMVVAALVAVAVGVGYFSSRPAKPAPRFPVAGVLLKGDGKPAATVFVTFWSTAGLGDETTVSGATTDKAGRFTPEFLDGGPRGIPAGTYKVTTDAFYNPLKSAIPREYTQPGSTPLEITIPPGGDTNLVIRLP